MKRWCCNQEVVDAAEYDAVVAALKAAEQRLNALRAYVPTHMFAAYLMDKCEIDAALAGNQEKTK